MRAAARAVARSRWGVRGRNSKTDGVQVDCQYSKISSEEGEDGSSSPLLASSPASDSDTGHAPHVC